MKRGSVSTLSLDWGSYVGPEVSLPGLQGPGLSEAADEAPVASLTQQSRS